MADTTVCTSDSPKPSEHKSALRKSNKPLMEKKRRARINSCLGQLKSLVLQALKKDTSQFSKLEKADILEMTVKHLKSVQQQHMSVAMATDPNVLTKYRAGFNECAGEVMRYLGSVNGLTDDTRTRVLNHLALCMQSVNTAASVSMATQAAAVANQISLGGHVGSLFPAFTSTQPQAQQTHVLPTSTLSVSTGSESIHTVKVPTPRIPHHLNDTKLDLGGQSSLQLIPGTLPSGQLAFFVASPTTPIQAIPVYTTPSSGSPTPVTSPETSPRAVDVKMSDYPQRPICVTPQLERLSTQSTPSGAFVEHKVSHHERLAECNSLASVEPRSPVDNDEKGRYLPVTVHPSSSSPFREPHQNPFHVESNRNKETLEESPDDRHIEDEEEKVWRPW